MCRRIMCAVVFVIEPSVRIHQGEDHLAKVLDKLACEDFATVFFYEGPVVRYGLRHLRNGNVRDFLRKRQFLLEQCKIRTDVKD